MAITRLAGKTSNPDGAQQLVLLEFWWTSLMVKEELCAHLIDCCGNGNAVISLFALQKHNLILYLCKIVLKIFHLACLKRLCMF